MDWMATDARQTLYRLSCSVPLDLKRDDERDGERDGVQELIARVDPNPISDPACLQEGSVQKPERHFNDPLSITTPVQLRG